MPILREPGPLRLPPDYPGADLPEALEPYLWLDMITPVWLGAARAGKAPLGWLEIRGYVKPFPGAEGPLPDDQEAIWDRARSVRSTLSRRAETAIIAAEDRGYRHERHPEFTITGEIRRDRDSGLDIPIAKAELRLWLVPR